MYVAELDRPWLDTPFLLEGVLLRNQAELATLSRYCQWVYVDLWYSTEEAADAIRAAAATATPEDNARAAACEVGALSLIHISEPTRPY